MTSLVGLGFHPSPGGSLCLFVRHAFEGQNLYVRFRHEGIGVQILRQLDRGRFAVLNFLIESAMLPALQRLGDAYGF